MVKRVDHKHDLPSPHEFSSKEDSSPTPILLVLLLPFVVILNVIGEFAIKFLQNSSQVAFFWLKLGVKTAFSVFIFSINLVLFYIKVGFLFLRKLLSLPKKLMVAQSTPDSLVVQPPAKQPKKVKEKPLMKLSPQVIYPIPIRFKLGYFFLGALITTLIFTPLVFRLWLSQLPNPADLAFREPALTTKIYDRNGTLLFQFYATQNRTKITLTDLPQDLIDATIAIEDKNYYHHYGFDVEAIVRAARETLLNKNLQGGSTITQQLIKSSLLTPEISLTRKIKEVILAFWAERLYSKDQILTMYFNQVPYGGTAWGIEAAAQTYFKKDVANLDLAESALLAGLPSGPSIYSPFGHPELAKQRQGEVLDRMVAEGFITQTEALEAKNQELVYASPVIDIRAPHFVMYVKDLLVKRFGIRMVEQGGLSVITTLDLAAQEQAADIAKTEVGKLASLSVGNTAAVITNPSTGDILAMVGSRDYFDIAHDGNVNVTTALRQPGSSIKVVTYAAALEKGLSAASLLDDSPITYRVAGSPAYSPVNYDGRFHGKVTIRDALANSYNVPAVKTLAQIGMPTMLEMGKRMGITTWNDPSQYGLSLTLGGGEVRMLDMATVYGVLANNGKRVDLSPFLEIRDSKGEIIEQKNVNGGQQVISEGIAFILSDILSDNNARASAFGTNSVLNIPSRRVSVKTGTTDQKRDNWTIGYTKDRLVAVWVGNNDNTPMNPALTSGITGAAPIWNKLMNAQLANTQDTPTTAPTEIVAVPVCRINGMLPCGNCPTRTEYFIQGTQPKLACNPQFLTPAPAIGGNEPTPTTR